VTATSVRVKILWRATSQEMGSPEYANLIWCPMDQVIASGDDEGKREASRANLDWMWKVWNGLKKEEHTRHPAVSVC